MQFVTRKIIRPSDLNAANRLFGGRVLQLVDEETAVYVSMLIQSTAIVTRFMSEVNFIAPALQGDIIEIGVETVDVGSTSITVRCVVRNIFTKQDILHIEKIVFVHLVDGKPYPHLLANKTK